MDCIAALDDRLFVEASANSNIFELDPMTGLRTYRASITGHATAAVALRGFLFFNTERAGGQRAKAYNATFTNGAGEQERSWWQGTITGLPAAAWRDAITGEPEVELDRGSITTSAVYMLVSRVLGLTPGANPSWGTGWALSNAARFTWLSANTLVNPAATGARLFIPRPHRGGAEPRSVPVRHRHPHVRIELLDARYPSGC